MENVSNKNARGQVERLATFKGSNTFGETDHNGTYKAYSYGYHFPMFAYKDGRWYENKDKYSRTTSKQQSQLRPSCYEPIGLTTEQIKAL